MAFFRCQTTRRSNNILTTYETRFPENNESVCVYSFYCCLPLRVFLCWTFTIEKCPILGHFGADDLVPNYWILTQQVSFLLCLFFRLNEL